jgi:uncharacterized SAM-binding protein YcdF (DUF218 family)
MFMLKKVIGALLSPVTGGLLFVLVLGVVAARARTPRTRRRAWLGLVLAFGLAWASGTTPVANALIRPFEGRAPAVLIPGELPEAETLRWVVVLGGGHSTDPALPPAAQLWSESLYRLVEGVRLHRALPNTELYLSGWGGQDPRSNAEVMADAAISMGVDPRHIELASSPRDTEEEAGALARFLRARGEADAPFLLVTSAAHLPRALRHMRAAGLDPIPAPAQAYAAGLDPWGRDEGFRRFVPQAQNYLKVERAVHEALGLLALRMAGLSAPFDAENGS